MLNEEPPSISQTVSSVTDLPIPSQKAARDNQQKTSSSKTPPLLRRSSRIKHRPQDDIEVQSLLQGDDTLRQDLEDASVAYLEKLSLLTQPRSVRLTELPVEVQEGVIDHLAGHLIGITPASAVTTSGSRNWSTAMRHPRRKQLSDLALVSKTWRALIQERLYRHSMLLWFALKPCVIMLTRNHSQSQGNLCRFRRMSALVSQTHASPFPCPSFRGLDARLGDQGLSTENRHTAHPFSIHTTA